MKWLNIMVLLLTLAAGCKNGGTKPPEMNPYEARQPTQGVDSDYLALRQQALFFKAEQLGLVLDTTKTVVYGVVMDICMETGITTVVSFKTGDASVYMSNGSGMIGGIKYAHVARAAKLLVRTAQFYVDKASKSRLTALPETNSVNFYLLTNKGIYSATEQLAILENGSSVYAPLFNDASHVISELKLDNKGHELTSKKEITNPNGREYTH